MGEGGLERADRGEVLRRARVAHGRGGEAGQHERGLIGEVSGGRVEVRSSCGDIEVGVRSGVAAWLELNTRNGMVRNGLTEGEPEVPTAETVEVHASTSYGDIVVKRVSD